MEDKTPESWFFNSEGDEWWTRNQTALEQSERLQNDPILRTLELFNVKPCRVLEIGAANGYRLAALQAKYGCRAIGIEPSEAAVQAGRVAFPNIDLRRGLAHRLPYENATFDVVIINFVLHWVSRELLLSVVAELDRVLENGGFLCLGDFAPSQPEKVIYHHLHNQNVWTWKQDYATIFTATQLYDPLATITYDHDSRIWNCETPPQHRASVTVLKKNVDGRYIETAWR